jgi:hypothetical protein
MKNECLRLVAALYWREPANGEAGIGANGCGGKDVEEIASIDSRKCSLFGVPF